MSTTYHHEALMAAERAFQEALGAYERERLEAASRVESRLRDVRAKEWARDQERKAIRLAYGPPESSVIPGLFVPVVALAVIVAAAVLFAALGVAK